MKRVVFFSGGVASWAAAKRVVEKHGDSGLTLLFADTKMEDKDLYRFLPEAAENVGGTLVRIAEGRTPWQVFFDEGFLGNSRVDPCSRILKREFMKKWLEDNLDPFDTECFIGYTFEEKHRMEDAIQFWYPWHLEAPLFEEPYLFKDEIFDWVENEGLVVPRLYDLGFAHNNCGGFCIKAGAGQFKHLARVMPQRFETHRKLEERFQRHVGEPVTILRKMEQGVTRRLSLAEVGRGEGDDHEWGGCGCV